eukprot:GHVU01145933.1.p4 GENE.GHVU01145933.1~~GHVU01145933.1.p4  ORF type:complete len:106 (-),score=6.50 GHVU01145933.1:1858-2175(-)
MQRDAEKGIADAGLSCLPSLPAEHSTAALRHLVSLSQRSTLLTFSFLLSHFCFLLPPSTFLPQRGSTTSKCGLSWHSGYAAGVGHPTNSMSTDMLAWEASLTWIG